MRGLCLRVQTALTRRPPLLQLPLQRVAVAVNESDLQWQRRAFGTRRDAGVSLRRQYISLYNYTPLDEQKLPKLRRELREQWGHLGVVGRIYIAQEGINGQLVVPEPAVAAFEQSFPRLLSSAKLFYGQLIEHNQQDTKAFPFPKLDVRIRDQILHDGFAGGELDLQRSGHSLPPEQWHRRLKTRNETHDSDTLVLDVRNFYEHEIGRFDGATRIMVDTFRDTFEALDEILDKHEAEHDGQKPKEVLMYCTGGIRCEKVGAYLTQYKGISNVHKLHGGIVNYMRFLKEQREAAAESRARSACAESDEDKAGEEISLFKGKNFVFDQRCVGELTESEKVTDDVLGKCFQCGEPCNSHTNCSNLMCHGLILQCSKCATSMFGACSDACKHEFVKMASMSQEEQREHRKANALKWKPRNPNAVKYINFRPVSPELLQKLQLKHQ